jgi:hypothetical protein
LIIHISLKAGRTVNVEILIHTIMAKSNVRRDDQGDGADFINHQRAVDEAKNESIKAERDTDKIDPEQANREKNRTHKTDVSVKKTGGGKQVTPGS